MKRVFCGLAVAMLLAQTAVAAVPAIDLSDAAVRARMPGFRRVSSEGGVVDGTWADGRWAYRFHITKSWNGELPQWPSVDIPIAMTNWVGYDRFVLDVYNADIGGDGVGCFIAGPTGRIQEGLHTKALALKDFGFHRWVIPLEKLSKSVNPTNVTRLHLFFTAPTAADIHVSGFHLLKPGEALPAVNATFQREKVEAGLVRAEELRKERRRKSVDRFLARCRAAGQSGDPCWIGRATSMEKVRPRANDFDVAAATSFSLKLARGERESLQVLVMPNGRDLRDVTVDVPALRRERNGIGDWFRKADVLPPSAFKVSPMGYVRTVNPPPYKGPVNVATNLPGGYLRKTKPVEVGWWPDPILDYLDKADVKGDDLQSFWVRCTCPDGQRAGTYRGTLVVRGEGWRREFPLTVRVYGFSVPKRSPLPLAITFSPGPNGQFADEEQLALIKKLKADPKSPANCWKAHEAEWGDFLADYYMTMDSLYHAGKGVHWDVLKRLKDQGRLGLFNLAYWGCVQDESEKGRKAWIGAMHSRLDESYAKAKELGLLDHAYIYGCDEASTNCFGKIKWSVAQLKRLYPGVPIFTTAYDHDFGIGSALSGMDWFTPTTERYAENAAKVPGSRAAGHQVWWYIACGPKAPFANMFVEYQAIEARQLMGAQTVKWRPDGFLYYQVSIWNSLRPISGPDTFTDWEPRSWTKYHGDGSWFCCGPEGRPCATVRMENFRDGLEDFAYALEYERVTGRTCEVPPEVCREIDQFTDDPSVYYAWRDRIAEAIEAELRKK